MENVPNVAEQPAVDSQAAPTPEVSAIAEDQQARKVRSGQFSDGMSATGRRRMVSKMMHQSASMPVDLSLPAGKRPLTGLDIEMWRQSMRLNIPKMSYALAIPSPTHYTKMAARREPLPMGLEILLRLYDFDSTPPPWHAPTMLEVYEKYYGWWVKQMIEEHGAQIERNARIRAYSRFAALFGRSPYTSYRWIDESTGHEANTKPDVDRIAGKVWEMRNGQAVLEKIAALVWGLRGMPFELLFPLRLDSRRRSRTHGA